MRAKSLNVSIVLYHTSTSEISKIVAALLASEVINNIFLVDNSETITPLYASWDVAYIFTGKNLGFGAAHNIAIRKSIEQNVKYHLVLNSDVSIDESIFETLVAKMDSNPNVGQLMPKILNSDGSDQLLPKLLPTPIDLLIRLVGSKTLLALPRARNYVLADFQHKELNVPILSGCFSLFRVEVLKNVGAYDESFFMYFEDFDLSRRVHKEYFTLYFPEVSITHNYERGARKSIRLFMVFVQSAIVYFSKYGWIFDKERNLINSKVLDQLI